MWQALGSIPSTAKKIKKGERKNSLRGTTGAVFLITWTLGINLPSFHLEDIGISLCSLHSVL